MTESSNIGFAPFPQASNGKPQSLKALAIERLQRNAVRKRGLTEVPWVPPRSPSPAPPQASECSKQDYIDISPSLKDDFEERIAIAEYDGQQGNAQALRIAYESALIAILNANPPNGSAKLGQDWLKDRMEAAESWLLLEGIERPA